MNTESSSGNKGKDTNVMDKRKIYALVGGTACVFVAVVTLPIVVGIARSSEMDNLSRLELALIPIFFLLAGTGLIWLFSTMQLDEMQNLIRMKGILYGFLISLLFFACYGILQKIGLDLPPFDGFSVVVVFGLAGSLGKIFFMLKYR